MTDTNPLEGKCLCGAVKISATTVKPSLGACHCTMCRKWAGGPLLTVECESSISFEGNEHIATFQSSDWAERGFCRQCGSSLFYRFKDAEQYFVAAGLFEGVDTFDFDHQIFIDEKPSYYTFADQTKNMTGAEVFAMYGATDADS